MKRFSNVGILLALAAVLCANTSDAQSQGEGPAFKTGCHAPTLNSLAPASVAHGGPAFTLAINGGCFVPGAVAEWSGVAQPTTYVSVAQVTIRISASAIAKPGAAAVRAVNPNGDISNTLTFLIN